MVFAGYNMNSNADKQSPCVISVFVSLSPPVAFPSQTFSTVPCIRMCMMPNSHEVRISSKDSDSLFRLTESKAFDMSSSAIHIL